MKFKKRLLAFTALAASAAFTGTVVAHETRVLPASVKEIRMTVGFNSEPAFEDERNGTDIFLYTFDGPCADPEDFWGAPISARNGDTVDLKVEALYLKDQTPPGGAPKGNIPPPGILKKVLTTEKSPLGERFGEDGRYQNYFRPTHPGYTDTGGAYGFHIYGNVKAKANSYQCEGDPAPHLLPARSANINTWWVCGNGKLDPNGHSFGCVQVLQPFPGTIVDGYGANPKPYPQSGAAGTAAPVTQ